MQLPSHQFHDHPCKNQKVFIGVYYQLDSSVYIEEEQQVEEHGNAVVFNYSISMKKNLRLKALVSMEDSRHNHTVNFSK